MCCAGPESGLLWNLPRLGVTQGVLGPHQGLGLEVEGLPKGGKGRGRSPSPLPCPRGLAGFLWPCALVVPSPPPWSRAGTSHRPDTGLPLRLLSPRPSLLTPTSDTRTNTSPQKPLDLKQLKQRAAAIPPIVSARPRPPVPDVAAAPAQLTWLTFASHQGHRVPACTGEGGATPAAACYFLEKSPWR